MARRLLSGLAVASVLGVTAAAVLDSLANGEPRVAAPPQPPPCREGQLALDLIAREERPVVVLRHARGPRCTAPDYEVVVEAPRGEPLVQEGTAGGLFAPGVQWERSFRFQPRCDRRGPFFAVVRVGPYSAAGRVPALPCLRTGEQLVAFLRGCVRSWNAAANRASRELVVEGGFDTATLFRSTDGVAVERCSLHFVSSASARVLLARRVEGRWSAVGGGRRPPASDDFHDARAVEIRPDGSLVLTDA